MQVTVLAADRTVVVDGLALKCAFEAPEGVQTIHWAGEHGVGQIAGGVAHGAFRDPATVAPYVAAWRAEIERRLARIADAQAIEKAAYEAHLADETQRDAERRAAAQADAAGAAGNPDA